MNSISRPHGRPSELILDEFECNVSNVNRSVFRRVGYYFHAFTTDYGMFRAHRAQDELRRPPCGLEIEFITIDDNEPGASALITHSDELDFSASWLPPVLILGSLSL